MSKNEMNTIDWDGKPSDVNVKALPIHINHIDAPVEAKPTVNKENDADADNVIQVQMINPIRQSFRVVTSVILLILLLIVCFIYGSKYKQEKADMANPYRNGSIFKVDSHTGKMAGIKEEFKKTMTAPDFENTVEALYDTYDKSYQKLLDEGIDPLLARQEVFNQFKPLLYDISCLAKEKFPSYKFDDRLSDIMQGYVSPNKGWFK